MLRDALRALNGRARASPHPGTQIAKTIYILLINKYTQLPPNRTLIYKIKKQIKFRRFSRNTQIKKIKFQTPLSLYIIWSLHFSLFSFRPSGASA
jgi:hypothetical protein